MTYQLIISPLGRHLSHDNYAPVYITVCKKPKYDTERLSVTSDIHSATKFEWNDNDISDILNYVRKKMPDQKWCVVGVDAMIFSTNPINVWNHENYGDYHETYSIGDDVVERRLYDD